MNDGPNNEADPVMTRARVFQIASARQELAPKYHGTAALPERMPNLMPLFIANDRYDTVNLEDCTHDGVAAVLQAARSKDGVAAYVMAADASPG